jgi:PAS domain S-box-containing protein
MGEIEKLSGSLDDVVFRFLVENTSAAIFIYQNNKIRYANAAFTTMVGYDEDELIEKNFSEVIHPDFRELEKELRFARQRGENVPAHYEIKLIRKSGEERWADFATSVINYQDEVAVLTTAYDITDRRIAKQKIEESEECYRLLVNRSPDAIMVQSDGELVYLNSAALKMLGVKSLDKLVGIPITEFVHPQSIKAVTAFFNIIAKSYKRAELNDVKFLRSDGSIIDVELVSVPTIYLRKPAFQIYLRDVTNQKQAREQLRLQSRALNTAANAIVITDKDASIVWANPAFETLTGYSNTEFMGKKIKDLVKSNKQDNEFYKNLWNKILTGKIWHDEIINRRKDGSTYAEDMTIAPVADENGTITHFIAIKQDLTERKSFEEQLLESKKLESIGELAGGVAHDYNNILGVILGHSELLSRKLSHDNQARYSVDAILSATKRGADLTKQLLTFAQKGMISPEVLNINSAIETTIGMLQTIRIISENVKLDFVPGRNLWNVKMDPSQLNQILGDLTANARDAIGKVGTITIRTSNIELDESYVRNHVGFTAGEYVMITFADSGKGMDKETMERVFEPFFTTKPKGQARGLGLSTVYGIVKRYKGNISVSSKPGAGTTFNIYLPRFYEEAADITGNLSDEQLKGTETILVVEDQAELLQLVKISLEDFGYKVMVATGPNEALLLSKTYPAVIHLLLTDVIMPAMSGKELSDEIVKTRPEMKTLFMSGYTENFLAPHVVLDKGIHFLRKPFTFDELAKRIRNILNLNSDL